MGRVQRISCTHRSEVLYRNRTKTPRPSTMQKATPARPPVSPAVQHRPSLIHHIPKTHHHRVDKKNKADYKSALLPTLHAPAAAATIPALTAIGLMPFVLLNTAPDNAPLMTELTVSCFPR